MIPAARIKQIRAILLKSRHKMNQMYGPFVSRENIWRAGRGDLSAVAASRSNMLRVLKDIKTGKSVPFVRRDNLVLNQNRRNPKMLIQQTPKNLADHPTYVTDRGERRREIRMTAWHEVSMDKHFEREAQRKAYRAFKKMQRERGTD